MLKGTAIRSPSGETFNVDLSEEFATYTAKMVALFVEQHEDTIKILEGAFHQISFEDPDLEDFMEDTWDAHGGHIYVVDRESLIKWAAQHKPTSLRNLGPFERTKYNVDERIAAGRARRKAQRNNA